MSEISQEDLECYNLSSSEINKQFIEINKQFIEIDKEYVEKPRR